MSGNEAFSDSRDSGKQQLDRNYYPYFSDEEFITFSKMGKDIVDKMHLSCKELYEKKIANFSLDREDCGYLEKDLKIVVYGKTGSGKSSTANSILGKESFKVTRSSHSVTKVSLDNTCTYKNRKITVVDTPGIHDTESNNATVMEQLARIAFLLKDGVHCFIICMSASDSRFTKDVEEMLKLIEQKGRGNFFDYCMLVYTKAETELKKCHLRNFLEHKKDHERNRCFLKSIKDRVVAVNNNSSIPAEALRNKKDIIQMVDVVVDHNRRSGKPVIFTNDMFKTASEVHAKIASIVWENKFHAILVNATIEAIVNKCYSNHEFDLFSKEVIDILKMRKTSEVNNEFADLFIIVGGTTKVNDKYMRQIRKIYDETKKEVDKFRSIILTLVVTAVGVFLSFFRNVMSIKVFFIFISSSLSLCPYQLTPTDLFNIFHSIITVPMIQ